MNDALLSLNALADKLAPKPRLRAMVAGRPSTGKTHLILSAPRPCVVLYCDRANGEVDLKEVDGVFRCYIKRGNVVRDTLAFLERIAAGDLSTSGIQTIALDSLTYLQSLVQADTVTGDKSASQRDFGKVVQGIERILVSLMSMDQDVLINSHLKSHREMGRDSEGREKEFVIWQPDAMPKVREIVMREVGLMGYTWRKAAPPIDGVDQPDRFGVNFTERMSSRAQEFVFQDAKAPVGWSDREEANVSAWISRLFPAPVKADPAPKGKGSKAVTA